MTYVPVAVYDYQTAKFIGYGVKDDAADKLQSTNVWKDGEEESLNVQLGRLNTSLDLKDHWPHPRDPEVTAFLDDPNFEPIEYEDREVVDDAKSYLVWQKTSELDEFGNPTGKMIDGTEIDHQASVVVYKTVKVPKRPTDAMLRIKKASEQVARKRAGI